MKAKDFAAKHGPDTFRTEFMLQSALVRWLNTDAADTVKGRFTAINNGGYSSKASAGKAKAEGRKPGIPDLIFWRDRGRVFWLELKNGFKSKASEIQWSVVTALHKDGHIACIAHTMEDAQRLISEFYA